jgi:hypothetical protein
MFVESHSVEWNSKYAGNVALQHTFCITLTVILFQIRSGTILYTVIRNRTSCDGEIIALHRHEKQT